MALKLRNQFSHGRASPQYVRNLAAVQQCPLLADSVAKRFWAHHDAMLIRPQAPMRNSDSPKRVGRFKTCVDPRGSRVLQHYRHKAEVTARIQLLLLFARERPLADVLRSS